MNRLITIYNSTLDWLENHEKYVLGFLLGVLSVIVVLLILNAHWLAAGVFAGLTAFNFYINNK